MCGIVGYVGTRSASDILIRGLKRLEYRGYDSAGVALLEGDRIEILKSEGKIENVEKLLGKAAHGAHCGIGHTRWATHGKPTTQNAHPHQTGHVVLVHNGIIENYQQIKKELLTRGHKPKSETDSELFGFLVLEEMNRGTSLVEAVRAGFARLEGACSVVVMSEKEPGVIVGVRNGSPLVAALDPQGGAVLASDAQPLLELTRKVIFLEHGDLVVGTAQGLRFFSLESGKPVDRPSTELDWSPDRMEKQGYPTFMLKEIHEQPTALVDTLNALLDRAGTDPFPLAAQPAVKLLDGAREISIVACGTSWHAALLGKYWLEKFARIPVNVELASEFRYRSPVFGAGAVVIAISQSGETADTLAGVRLARASKVPTIGVTNVRGSTLSREADSVLYTAAGPEIGVAATKTLVTQLFMLLLIAGYLGIRKGGEEARLSSELFTSLVKVPHLLAESLLEESGLLNSIRSSVERLSACRGFFFIGRGYSFPVALEGALKLKEIAYVHAEGYAAGELKHGPIAMIDPSMALIVLAPRDSWREKTVSNLEEVKARGGVILSVGDPSDLELKALSDLWVPLPKCVQGLNESLLPFFLVPVMQLLSYEIAIRKGTDVDKPRNLAKSVTVE